MAGDKCGRCNRSVKDGIQCFVCKCYIHVKCASITEEVYNVMLNNENFRYFCDGCLKLTVDWGSVSNAIKCNHDELSVKIDQIRDELAIVKKVVDSKENAVSNAKIDEELNKFKYEMNNTWASVVKGEIGKNVADVNKEVRSVKKLLEERSDREDRENNLVRPIFGLNEVGTHVEDMGIVHRILSHVSDVVKESDVDQIVRMGRKKEGIVRPVLVKFKTGDIRKLVIRGKSKIKTLEDNLKNIGLSDDLTLHVNKGKN